MLWRDIYLVHFVLRFLDVRQPPVRGWDGDLSVVDFVLFALCFENGINFHVWMQVLICERVCDRCLVPCQPTTGQREVAAHHDGAVGDAGQEVRPVGPAAAAVHDAVPPRRHGAAEAAAAARLAFISVSILTCKWM